MDDEGDEAYFDAYDDVGTHELMLKDAPRMNAYCAAIEANKDFIRGRVVLDVGAGTGVLSLLAARAGAARVYAVEASGIVVELQKIVSQNGFGDVITVLHGRAEDVELPEQGFHLLHESMLNSVVVARDRWLKAGGRMLPNTARVYAAPVDMSSYAEEHFAFWSNVVGFDMSNMAVLAAQRALSEPLITDVQPSQLLAPAQQVAALDCQTVTLAQLTRGALGAELSTFTAARSGVCHGFVLFFAVGFPGGGPDGTAEAVQLSTAPDAPSTHWKQTVIWLPEMLLATAGTSTLACKLSLRSDEEQPRMCVLDLEM